MVSIYIALYLFLAGTGGRRVSYRCRRRYGSALSSSCSGRMVCACERCYRCRFDPRSGACGGERAFSFSRLGCARSGVSPLSCFDLQSSFHGCVGYSGILRDGDARIGPGVTC